MKLLAILAVAVTLGLFLVWGFTDASDEGVLVVDAIGPAHAPVTRSEPEPPQLEQAGGEASERELPDLSLRTEILVTELDFDLPTSHWMPEAPPIGELEHPNGPWLRLHENGVIDEQGAYENDLEIGRWKWWYENGQRKAIGQFENGLEVGTWTWWHENGAVLGEGQYENGEGYGPWKLYHENGNLWKEGNYVGGELSGRWSFYFPSGMVDEEHTGIYEAGVKVK